MKRLFAAFAVVIGLAVTTFAEEPTIDLSTVDNDVTIETGTVLHGTLGENVKISIAAGAYVTLSNAVINGVNNDAYQWAGLTCLGNAYVVLLGANTVQGFNQNYPGISVPAGSRLWIMDAPDYYEEYPSGGSLTVRGGGSGSSAYAAGIGAGPNVPCGDIVIESGTVNAYGGQNSAGIGGAYGSQCGKIDIYGGTISAHGGNYGPGIGAGRNGSCGKISIEGGTVLAEGDYGSSGIGGPGSSCAGVYITAEIDRVTAVSGDSSKDPINAIGTTIDIDGDLNDKAETSSTKNTRTIWRWNGDLSTLDYDTKALNGTVIHGTLAHNVKVSIAVGAEVTLSNAVINGVSESAYPWAGLTCIGDATIILEGVNDIRGFYHDYPGIYVPEYDGNNPVMVDIMGDGQLTASSNGHGAGIGGGRDIDCGSIQIWSGTIIANGGSQGGAGIGGGYTYRRMPNVKCGDIYIYGGTITATGGWGSAGIGGGPMCDQSWTIGIMGGSVTATGGAYAPGIGSGKDGKCGYDNYGGVDIDLTSPARIVATRGSNCENAIGAGHGGSCNTVDVILAPFLRDDEGDPTRTIAPWDGNLATLDDDVVAADGTVIYGTLSGNYKVSIADGATVTISNVVISGENDIDYEWAGINCEGDATILLEDSNYVKGFYEDWPGIFVDAGYTLTIGGSGSLHAESNGWGAGIGGSYSANCGNIVIESGMIVAEGGECAAGIGGGDERTCGDITILGGSVTATGGDEGAAGIGCGATGKAGDITIKGGTVVATGGNYGAGIGSGSGASSLAYSICGKITILGGDVTATGGDDAAGIGGGKKSKFGDIDILGGDVTATGGGDYAAGIGGGYRQLSGCGGITIGDVNEIYDIHAVRVVATRSPHCVNAIGSGYESAEVTLVSVAWYLTDTTSGYTRTVAPWDGDLSLLQAGDNSAVALDGTVIHGTLAANVGVNIAAGATVVVSNAVINRRNEKADLAGINCIGDATIVLDGENDISGYDSDWPGIYVQYSDRLAISNRNDEASLVVSRAGRDGAGIGGGKNQTCGDIAIYGGNIEVTGGWYSAGIGGGGYDVCGNIEIYGGNISVTGGSYGAGIGGGREGECGDIAIYGGTVQAVGGSGGAGIGAGYGMPEGTLSVCGDISIGAGIDRVEATAGGGAAPIGTGEGYSSCGTLSIDSSLYDDDGTPTRTISAEAPAVWNGDLAALTGNVTIESDMTIYGRLGGLYKISVANGVTLTLNGIEIPGTGNSSYKMAGIECLGNVTIILAAGSANTVKGCHWSPGIYVPFDSTLTIKGTGSLSATGGYEGAGIGGGHARSNGNIVIESGTITATGKGRAAGIGSGDGPVSAGDITILGGTVTATGGSFSAGIGGGAVCGNITISGGNVTATGADLAPGIGCGRSEHESFTVRINGGTVTAVGGENAAGIGGGEDSSGGNIVIEAGATLVTATHGTGCDNAIGAGDGGYDFSVTVDSGLFDVTVGDTRTISHVAPPVQSETVGGTTWYYRARGTGVEIYRDEPPAASPVPSGALEIPSSLGGCQVVAVGASAFASSAGFSSVAIPDGVTSIGQQAFYGCQSLTSVTIPGSVTSIGTSAFASSGLGTVYVPEGRTNFVKDLLLASGHEQAFVDGITFAEIPWNGNLAGLCYDMTITRNMTIYGDLAGQYKISIADGVTVTLDNAAITNGVSGQSYSWAGLTCLGDAEIVLAADSVNSVKGFYYEYPGIYIPVGKTLTISGSGSLTAESNSDGAGIGAGDNIDCGNIIINGGTVKAIGGSWSAGIGGGRFSNCGAITINGGTVRATGGYGAAGIGGGYCCACGDIAINGGTVWATGGRYSAGIGGGMSGTCGSISIGEGVALVVATCGDNCSNAIGAGANSGTMTGELYIHPSLEDDEESPTRTIGELPTFVNGKTGGSAFWTVLGDGTWKSGDIDDSQVTWASVPVTGPCGVSFSWKTSSESSCDKLHCYVDGVETLSAISGVMTGWADVMFVLRESGEHEIKFAYTKNANRYSGEDCGWVKNFTTAPFVARTVTFDANGGTLADDEMEAADGFAIGELPVPVWNGAGHYVFAGWYTEVSGGTRVTAVTIVRSDMTLYAHWDEYIAPAFTTGGDAVWTEQPGGSWKSGTIDNNGNTWISTTATGKGTISFRWKVSSENGYDGVLFYIDDEYMESLSGEQDWMTRTFTVSTDGTHTFKWKYQKDSSSSAGDDCAWIDEVVWTPDAGGYDSWASENGVTGGWSAVDANGIANVFRYVFNKATGDFAVILGIEFNAEGKAVIKTPPVVNEAGFTLSIKASDDLDGTGNTATYGLNPTGETLIDEATSAKRFFRLRAERN